MPFDNTIHSRIQPLLMPGEQLLWAGRPGQGVRLRASDGLLIPFSVMWGGFAVFWEWSVLTHNTPPMFKLWGIPFVLIGLFLIFGRFIADAWVRSGQVYGLTNQRTIIIGRRKVITHPLRSLDSVTLNLGPSGNGTVSFSSGGAFSFYGRNGFDFWLPSIGGRAFEFLPDASYVHRLISEAQSYPTRNPHP